MTIDLVGDIGGTNARLALSNSESGELLEVEVLAAADYPDFKDAVRSYLKKFDFRSDLKRACFAVASPIVGDHVSFTNNPWSFSKEDLKREFGLDVLKVINDFEAMARSLPYLANEDLTSIGGRERNTERPMAILGPGTGLGMAALIPFAGKKVPLATEGGHAGFCPGDEREQAIKSMLSKSLGFVCNEDLLSGRGIENIYRSLGQLEGRECDLSDAAAIGQAALEGTSILAQDTFSLFWKILGSVAGDYAMQTGAVGGVFIGGGIPPRYIELIKNSQFREQFVSKGTYRDYLEGIATYVVSAKYPGLVGAAAVFEN